MADGIMQYRNKATVALGWAIKSLNKYDTALAMCHVAEALKEMSAIHDSQIEEHQINISNLIKSFEGDIVQDERQD